MLLMMMAVLFHPVLLAVDHFGVVMIATGCWKSLPLRLRSRFVSEAAVVPGLADFLCCCRQHALVVEKKVRPLVVVGPDLLKGR